jgi:hypothetical protein
MDSDNKRVLGRILAVEETTQIHGATGRDVYTGDPSGVAETTPVSSDTTATIDDTTNPPFNETYPESDSGTASDTGIALDCGSSGGRRDIYLPPIDCP